MLGQFARGVVTRWNPCLLNSIFINATVNCQRLIRGETFKKPQQFRNFSNPANPSVQTSIMDGAGDRKAENVDYEGLLKAQEEGVFIIDVREQDEIDKTGKLPGSIHIPMGSVATTLTTLSEEAFKSKFDKSKPDKDTKVIVSCMAGRRSQKVQEELQKLGYSSVYNYSGGWSEWTSRQKA